MVQQTFTDMEYANRKRTTRCEAFLDAIYDSYAMKHFLKIDFSTEQTPPMPRHFCTFVTCSKSTTSPARYSMM